MQIRKTIRTIKAVVIILAVLAVSVFAVRFYSKYVKENRILKQVIERLEADSRIAQVLVTDVDHNAATGRTNTTIKFLELDVEGMPLKPKYFTFSGNIIQFQSLVIRFEDIHIRKASKFKDKSAYLFWKVFMLDGKNTQEFEIAKINQIPQGYKIKESNNYFEEKLWQEFWNYALDPEAARRMGIRNAQIEAPGTMFVPGMLYTINIEHDGGIRIDSVKIPEILKGEQIPE